MRKKILLIQPGLTKLKIILILFFFTFFLSYSLLVLRSTYGADLPGDVDGNGTVNIVDLDLFAQAYGKSAGQPGYNPSADFWPDSRINSADLFVLIENFGRSIESPTPTIAISTTPSPTRPPVSFLPAFPGAEGFGAKSKGGRGGTIHRVTNLNNSGSGSLRACVEASGPRYCIFDVSGTINLVGNKITVNNPFLTIAGQTAPSPGITIRGGTFQIKTNDVIIQHLRFRYGDQPCVQDDALQFHTTSARNIIADHVSVSWGVDENVNTYQNPQDITLSNSIVAEALSNSCHSEGEHSKGLLIQDPTTRFSLINSLFMNNVDRNPYIKDLTSSAIVNNVFYNRSWQKAWATKLGSGGGQALQSSIVGNVYIEGDASAGQQGINIDGASSTASRFYIQDNISHNMNLLVNNLGSQVLLSSPPVWPELISPDPAISVESSVKLRAGARPKDRDTVDQRLISELSNRQGQVINSQSEVGGWPNLTVNQRTFPVPTNPNGDDDGDGYTNLEELFHQYADSLLNTPGNTPTPVTATGTRTPTPSLSLTMGPTVTRTITPTRTITSQPSPTQPPVNFIRAFPGAEGFGARSKGGRGGTVFRITNLNDNGAGSLRACIIATGPRYCIFDISGTINLATQLDITNPFITIAGESAPSPGITLKNHTLSVKTNDVVIRHLRIRVGDQTNGDKDSLKFNDLDAFNIIADHMSISWAIDENFSTWESGTRDNTFSNSIVSEALHNSVHSQGPHSKGLFVGDQTKNISLINILAAHNDDRNFLTKAGGSTESINNLYYNWQEPDGTEIGAGGIATVIGNVYIKGPNTSSVAKGLSRNLSSTFFGQDIISIGLTGTNGQSNTATRPIWSGLTSPDPSSAVENMLYQTAGARPRDRDSVDTRIINEVRTRTGRIIDSQNQVGGWPNLAVNRRTFPVPANPNGDDDHDGYTNLEELLHQHANSLQ